MEGATTVGARWRISANTTMLDSGDVTQIFVLSPAATGMQAAQRLSLARAATKTAGPF